MIEQEMSLYTLLTAALEDVTEIAWDAEEMATDPIIIENLRYIRRSVRNLYSLAADLAAYIDKNWG